MGHRGFLTDKGVPPSDGAVELSWNSKVDEFYFGIVGEKNVLTLDVAMDDFVGVEVAETAQDLAANVRYPLLLQTLSFCRLDEVCDWAGAAVLHHQPQLIIFPRRWLLDECPIVCGNVAMVRILFQHINFELNLLLLILGHVHDFDGSELTGFRVSTLSGGWQL